MTRACIIVTCGGPAIATVSAAALVARTRRIGLRQLAVILHELRVSAAQDRVRR